MSTFQDHLAVLADRVTVALNDLLPRPAGPEKHLISAMRYAALGPGKRLRPYLLIEGGRLVKADEQALLRAACAVECMHAYSLVHDDLPCMDDDDLRRGRPTVHREYNEATGVLVGDALQSQAFELLADPETHASSAVRAELVLRLARASGPRGMVGGQMIDMAIKTGEAEDITVITRCQRMKTGSLISFCAEAGPVIAGADGDVRLALEGFAHDLGLCYQIVDDLLDAKGDDRRMGKRIGKDAGQGKATFVSILGVEGARDRAIRLADQAKAHLDPFGDRAGGLHEVIDYILARQS